MKKTYFTSKPCIKAKYNLRMINIKIIILERNVLRQVILLTLLNQSQQLTTNYALLVLMSNYVRWMWASVRYSRWTLKEILLKLSDRTLWTHQWKKLKIIRPSSGVTWKVFCSINILRECEQHSPRFRWLANRLTDKN